MNTSMNTSNIKSFPIFQFILAIVLDIAEFSFPIGYVVGLVGDAYLYTWAVKYLEVKSGDRKVEILKTKSQGSLKRNLLLRLVLEVIPIINFLPISTYFVYTVWRDKTKNIVL